MFPAIPPGMWVITARAVLRRHLVCGRLRPLFEGTPAQMFDPCKLAALPGDTQVYCTHEYTLSNLAFAAAVEPGNSAIAERIAPAKPCVPMSAHRALPAGWRTRSNPFLRTHEEAVIRQAEAQAGRPRAGRVFAACGNGKTVSDNCGPNATAAAMRLRPPSLAW
jgi:glyoxylase-like metal-dependent hydrolase (beta-lactamase superfamily II)